ncbi:MAG: hypothetical protein ACLS70_05525 [[Clostridium] symbiosum]
MGCKIFTIAGPVILYGFWCPGARCYQCDIRFRAESVKGRSR